MGARKHTVLARLLRRAKGEGCVIFAGYTRWDGYGRIGSERGGKSVIGYAHREMWEAVNGPIPEGMEVMHECHRPACIAPWHLKLGTHAENMADRDASGRTFTGSRSKPERLTPLRHLAYQNEAQARRRERESEQADQQ